MPTLHPISMFQTGILNMTLRGSNNPGWNSCCGETAQEDQHPKEI